MTKGQKHSNLELEQILTKDFLFEEYVTKEKASNIISREIGCSTGKVIQKIKEYKFPSLKSRKQIKYQNLDKISELGFLILDDYKGGNYKTKIRCHCGNEFECLPDHILSQHTQSCGCKIKNNRPQNWLGHEHLSGKEFGRFKRGAKKRNIEFSILIEDVWNLYIKQNKKCSLTNIDLYWDSKTEIGNASIDRINNSKGYTKDNIQIVLKDVNMMKRHHTQDYFLYVCSMVGKNFQNIDFNDPKYLGIIGKQKYQKYDTNN